MVSISCEGVAVGFIFFWYRSSTAILGEFMPLYMKQLGYSALFIGLVPMFGLLTQTLGAPLIGYLADKLRARKLFFSISLLLSLTSTLLFLVPSTPDQPCRTTVIMNSSGTSENVTARAILRSQVLESRNSTISEMSLSLYRATTTIDMPAKEITVQPTEQFGQIAKDGDAMEKERLYFFLIILFIRGIYQFFQRINSTFITVATMTHIKNDKTKYGYYACWGEVGAGVSLFLVGVMVNQIRHLHCGNLEPGYFITFLCASGAQCLMLPSLPWLKYEYLERRVVNYREVKRVLFDPHYLLLLVVCFHGGLCTSFQLRWEFWYMEKLGGTPLVIGVGGSVRRPMVALWLLLSRSIINRVGELYVIAISLFTFAASFVALASITNPWLVIVFDSFQSAAQAWMFSSLVIQFSKASSTASSSVIQGIGFSKLT